MVSKANLFLPDWYNNGIRSIADIVFGNGKFISQNDLKTVYHIRTNFLEHHRVITCVKNYLSKQKDDFYRILANQNMVHDTTYYSFWEQALGITICTDLWKWIFQVCFKTIKDNDLIWMQYKVLY